MKTAETTQDTSPQIHADLKAAENEFIGIKEYSSATKIAEKIDKETAETKSKLGEYLRQLDDKRAVAEKSQKLHDVVAKLANKKENKENPNKIDVNGLEIVLDATALNELTAIESVVKSHQQRLLALQKAKEALEPLDQFKDTEGIRYLVLEREGIPEQILLKIS
jgi:acetate kinase